MEPKGVVQMTGTDELRIATTATIITAMSPRRRMIIINRLDKRITILRTGKRINPLRTGHQIDDTNQVS
ncbi:MAG: hypothetical protein LQ350_005083 [Teloschistes chrysophthalmus]|nr:MAG: hypothetical protein LQ350_005083 [Niorma chrysophthalma]